MTLSSFFTEPMAYDFMQRGMVVAILVGAVCALLSCFLVLKGWSLMGDAVSHAVLPGIVIAYALSVPLVIGAFAAGLTCALATGYLRDHSRIKEDAVMGIVFSGMFAVGIVLFVKVPSDQHLDHILFGNMLGVSWADVRDTALIAVPAMVLLLAKRRDLMVWCFDPGHARAIGLNVGALHYGLLAVLALTIVAALKAVGIILVIAMLIAPAAIAMLITRRFGPMMGIAVVAAVGSSVLGTLLSYHLDGATGPMIVVVQATLFVLALVGYLVRKPVPA